MKRPGDAILCCPLATLIVPIMLDKKCRGAAALAFPSTSLPRGRKVSDTFAAGDQTKHVPNHPQSWNDSRRCAVCADLRVHAAARQTRPSPPPPPACGTQVCLQSHAHAVRQVCPTAQHKSWLILLPHVLDLGRPRSSRGGRTRGGHRLEPPASSPRILSCDG
jgi:hypothetical protein